MLAAQKLGIADVPVMVARGWTEAKRSAYVLADNRLAQNAGSDDEMLRLELGDLLVEAFDLGLTGFGTDELASLLTPPTTGLTDPDGAPEPQAEVVSSLGDVWVLGRHRLVSGDCTDGDTVTKALGGVVPHLRQTVWKPAAVMAVRPELRWQSGPRLVRRATGPGGWLKW